MVKTTRQHLFLLRELSTRRHQEHLVQEDPYMDGKLSKKGLKGVGHLAEGNIGTTHPKSDEDS